MLNRHLVILIHPNEPLKHVSVLQRYRLHNHVRRVSPTHILELVIDLDRADQLELAVLSLVLARRALVQLIVLLDNVEEALDVALIYYAQALLALPHNPRANDLNGALALCMVPLLHVDQVLGNAHVLFLSLRLPHQELLLSEVEVELVLEIR